MSDEQQETPMEKPEFDADFSELVENLGKTPPEEPEFDDSFQELAKNLGKTPMEAFEWICTEMEIDRDRMMVLATGKGELTAEEAGQLHLTVISKMLELQLQEDLQKLQKHTLQEQMKQEQPQEVVVGGPEDGKGLPMDTHYTETDWTEDPDTMMACDIRVVTAMSENGKHLLPVAVFKVLDTSAEGFKEKLRAYESLVKAGVPEELIPELPSKPIHLIISTKSMGMRMVEEVLRYAYCPELMLELAQIINTHECNHEGPTARGDDVC